MVCRHKFVMHTIILSLAFNFVGAIGLGNNLFGRDRPEIARVTNVRCSGTESFLSNCAQEIVEDGSCETASAVCQSKYTIGLC